ncbi:MAG: hypothetical protein ACI9S8_002162, partial [Chlamydiales bacterium]
KDRLYEIFEIPRLAGMILQKSEAAKALP